MADFIDRDKLIMEGWSLQRTYQKDAATMVCEMKKPEDFPVADVWPVRRGLWAPHPDPNCKEWDVCTACGTGCKRREYGTNPDGTDYVTEWSYPYCPNCGSYNVGDADG